MRPLADGTMVFGLGWFVFLLPAILGEFFG
jgi:hypothetical protein